MTEAETIWLSLRRLTACSDVFLREHIDTISKLGALCTGSFRLVLWIRGSSKSRPAAVYLRHEDDVLVADCALHIQSDQPILQDSAFPIAKLYHLAGTKACIVRELAISIYARLLAPFSSCLVFVEEDHHSVEDIVDILAHWCQRHDQSRSHQRYWTHPTVVLFVLGEWNAKTIVDKLCSKVVNGRVLGPSWNQYFDRVIVLPREKSEKANLDKLKKQKDFKRGYVVSGTHFLSVFQNVCAQFAKSPLGPLDMVRAHGQQAQLEQMQPHIKPLLELFGAFPILPAVVASAIVRDSYGSDRLSNFSARVVIGLYEQILPEKKIGLVKDEFIKIGAGKVPLLTLGALDLARLQAEATGTCLLCCAAAPGNGLEGGRACDVCLLALLDAEGDTGRQRPVGAVPREYMLNPKPRAAKVRVLQLAGSRDDADSMFGLLRGLERRLAGVGHYFDMVFCSGMGILVGVSFFVDGLTTEECRYRMRATRAAISLQRRRRRFHLDKGCKYPYAFSDIAKSGPKLVLQFDSYTVRSYGHHSKPPDKQALERRVHDECAALWPGASIAPIIHHGPAASSQAPPADAVVALSLYIEKGELARLPRPAFCLTIACRIPPGPCLLALQNTLQGASVVVDAGRKRTIVPCMQALRSRRGDSPFRLELRGVASPDANTVDVCIQHQDGTKIAINNSPWTIDLDTEPHS